MKVVEIVPCSFVCLADTAGGGLGMSMTLVPNLAAAADEQRAERVNGDGCSSLALAERV